MSALEPLALNYHDRHAAERFHIETGGIHDAGKHGPGLRGCFFKDPEGNILELMEGWQDEATPG